MKTILFVGFAAIPGALLRYFFAVLLNSAGVVPIGTFLANMLGVFILAFFTASFKKLPVLSEEMKAAIGTGLIGSFTTFSTFSVEVVTMLDDGAWLAGFLYAGVSLVAGLCLAYIGYHLGLIYMERRERTKI